MGHTTYNLPRKENIDGDETDEYCYVTEDEFEALRFKVYNLFNYFNRATYSKWSSASFFNNAKKLPN